MTTPFADSKCRIGITGQTGFIGSHLAGLVRTSPDFQLIEFQRDFFRDPEKLRAFCRDSDAVVHLAGLSRHDDGDFLYRTNLELSGALADAVLSLPEEERPRIYFGSTTHLAKQLPYHASKRDSQALLETRSGASVITLLMANTFGPYSRPFYNSVVSTFCYLAAAGRTPEQISDVELNLIDVRELASEILHTIRTVRTTGTVTLAHRETIRLPELWRLLMQFRKAEEEHGVLRFATCLEEQLYETFHAYFLASGIGR